ncbi:GAK system ATP-grasp enzyme [Cobetia sp. L2A1]|uniref:GAK system ATP-grasp enzyme n=1 Tax=Cobetia sp. L2A1 TaxID=2686360 RepID=UPI00131E8CE3|nr:GAK system ATP-grasp enzyme [Cobetia sp. L2A1]
MINLKIGVVGIPGKWSTEVLADLIEARSGFRLVIDMAAVSLDLDSGQLLYRDAQGEMHDLSELDALVVKKISREYAPGSLDRLELLRVAEARGVRVFSRAESMIRLIDRLSCSVTMANAGIPMPATLVTEDITAACAAVKRYGAAVFKPLFSTKARGMCIIEDTGDDLALEAAVRDFSALHPMMYLQQRLNLPGQDYGMVFVGGRYLCSYARMSGGDAWNTTIHAGGKYAPFTPSDDLIALAERAQAPFNLDFTTVDVALTDDGPIVFEVSAFGGFRGALEGAGVDAAAAYLDHVLEVLS